MTTESRRNGSANLKVCTPQIMQCKLARYYPAGSSVEAATTQSRVGVAMRDSASGQSPLPQVCDLW